MSDIEKLKKAWNDWTNTKFNDASIQKKDFDEWMKQNPLEQIELDKYTNLKISSDNYFTHWLERKTETCGKFRTASSFAYGVYRIKNSNVAHEYKSVELRNQKDVFLNEDKAKEFFDTKVRPDLVGLSKFEDVDNDKSPLEINFSRKVAYMFNTEKLLPIFRNETIEAIADFFGLEKNEDYKLNNYKATEKILDKIKIEFGIQSLDFEITQKLGNFLWENFGNSFSIKHKNIIFYGAPGTGKTYTVMEGIRQQISLSKNNPNEVMELAQFHPSYSYEDFIEGLKPVVGDNGAISLKLQPGRFKQLCKKATVKLKAERSQGKKDNELTKFYFVADEINRAELSRVLGEVLVCLEESKRIDFDKFGNLTKESLYLKSQYGHLDNEKDAVLTIDGHHYFGVPSNLYFIGTMNDIDRSIDSFDLALRRRFVWEEKLCKYDVIQEELIEKNKNDESSIEQYIELCEALNKKISKEWRLGTSYEIGHSYFMKIGKITQSSLNELFNTSISPLLKEYLRAEYDSLDIEKKLKEAKAQFSWGKKLPSQLAE